MPPRRGPIVYPVGTQVPGTHLTPTDYTPPGVLYTCECGAEVRFQKALVEGRYRRSCGQCRFAVGGPPKKCIFCRGLADMQYMSKNLCRTCLGYLKELQ